MKGLAQKVECISECLDKAYEIIHNQQLFLETLDSKERRRNSVVTGLTEDLDENGETDKEVIKVLEAAGYPEPTHTEGRMAMKRLGPSSEKTTPHHRGEPGMPYCTWQNI